MIDRIAIENFKSLRKVDLSLGRMNLFIGTNASGKSNFLDALRVLQGIGNGFTMSEILDGKPKSATSAVWDGIRGGSSRALFAGSDETGEVTITVHGRLAETPDRSWEYSITFVPAAGRVVRERLRAGELIYDATESDSSDTPAFRVLHHYANPERPPDRGSDSTRPVLAGFAGLGFFGFGKDDVGFDQGPFYSKGADLARKVATLLANTQRVEPSPSILRQYSAPHDVHRMGDRGEDFAALVKAICQDEKVKDAYLAWLRELRPEEIDDVSTLSGAVGESLFVLRENDREVPATVLSDGTLRFAAIVAAFFQPDMPEVMTIEEIENGIHPSRLRLLVELLLSQSRSGKAQVFATTHSPTTLAWLQEAEYRTTFVCKRDEETGESTIRPLTDVPHFSDVSVKYPLSDLFAEGWLEAVL